MDRFEFYKEQYFKEHDRHNEINESLSLPIGVMTGIVAALFYFVTNFDYEFNVLSTIIFGIAVFAVFALLIMSIFFVIKSYANLSNGYGYKYLADTKDLDKYYCGLKKYYTETPGTADTTDTEFKDYLLKELITNTDANQKSNKQKSYYRYMANKFIIIAFPFILLSLFPFAYNYALAQKPKELFNIELISPLQFRQTELQDTVPDTIRGVVTLQPNDSADRTEKPSPPPSQQTK